MDDLKIGECVEVVEYGAVRWTGNIVGIEEETEEGFNFFRILPSNSGEEVDVASERVRRYRDRLIPFSYRKQECCHNCCFVFVMHEYEGGDRYFCLINAEHPRLRCGSVAMGEGYMFDEDIEGPDCEGSDWLSIESWYNFRLVNSWGICDEYKKEVW